MRAATYRRDRDGPKSWSWHLAASLGQRRQDIRGPALLFLLMRGPRVSKPVYKIYITTLGNDGANPPRHPTVAARSPDSMSDHRSLEAAKAQFQHDEKLVEDQSVAVDSFGSHAKSDPAEIKLVRKLDWFILPTLWLMYWFNYLDRNAITVARLDGMEEDLNLSSVEYQTCVSILFVGYILGQIPSSM